ncbi:DUF6011 domain-containing protein [Actinomadura litoris]|uniref:SWIM-type domain-containing protein n=1 Tax=Actinomadura litoris TaxID=2678616 RepID=A0A7K1L413_9ACTN|nr:DUF6011 domain-containing protein [Actinomadura litoris]MUN38996.1 hypothetical protein [Actinomadura litoris]
MATTATPKTTNCRRCRSLLTSARSVARGYGDQCWKQKQREDAVKAAGFKAHQVASARELIEDGAIVPLKPGLFVVVSSDGSEFYETTVDTCACPAYEAGRACYHRAAVLLAA